MKINQNGVLYKSFALIANLIALNLCFVVGSIPLITIGVSITCMYRIVLKMWNKEPVMVVSEFFSMYKSYFKQATIMWIIDVLIGLMLVFNIYIMKDTGKMFFDVYRTMMIFFFIILVVLMNYSFVLLSVFDNTILETYKNAFIMMFKHFFTTIRVVLILFITSMITLSFETIFLWLIGIYIFIGFALITYWLAHPLKNVINQYKPKDEWIDPYAKYESNK